MQIGVPREILPGEGRVAVIPETVKTYIAKGFEVAVQASAGVPPTEELIIPMGISSSR